MVKNKGVALTVKNSSPNGETRSPVPEKDEVFREKKNKIDDFNFGPQVASVFEDMLDRSVPFYHEIQRMITEIGADFAAPGSRIYDLGCSTGTTLLNLDSAIEGNVGFVGIDNSNDMLERCRVNFVEHGVKRPYSLECRNLNEGIEIENASVVVMCLTLQFIRPLYRETLVKRIFEQLNENGCLILVEKVLGEHSLFNRLFINYYYNMKRRNKYSELEISQKREALENVLIPYKLLENREMLQRCGFRYVDTFFKWYNFSGMIAVKN